MFGRFAIGFAAGTINEDAGLTDSAEVLAKTDDEDARFTGPADEFAESSLRKGRAAFFVR